MVREDSWASFWYHVLIRTAQAASKGGLKILRLIDDDFCGFRFSCTCSRESKSHIRLAIHVPVYYWFGVVVDNRRSKIDFLKIPELHAHFRLHKLRQPRPCSPQFESDQFTGVQLQSHMRRSSLTIFTAANKVSRWIPKEDFLIPTHVQHATLKASQ